MQRRQRIGLRLQLQARADAEGAEREAEPGLLQELLDPPADRAAQLLRVRALEADGHVGQRDDAVEVDQHGHEPFLPLAVGERALQQARLAVLPGRVEPDVVAADRVLEQRLGLLVAIDDLVGLDRARVDERVDVGDHGVSAGYLLVVPEISLRVSRRIPHPIVAVAHERASEYPPSSSSGEHPWSLRRRDRCGTALRGTPRSHLPWSSSPSPAAARYVLQDDTPPLSPLDRRHRGTNGWYRGSASGPSSSSIGSLTRSPVTSTTGCEPAIRIDDPNTGQRDLLGLELGRHDPVTTKLLKVDATPAVDVVAATDAPNGAGWYRAPVMLQWSGTDTTSGIASCSQQTYGGPDAASTSRERQLHRRRREQLGCALTTPLRLDASHRHGHPSPAPNSKGGFGPPSPSPGTARTRPSGLRVQRSRAATTGPTQPERRSAAAAPTSPATAQSAASRSVRYAAPTTTAAPTTRPEPGWLVPHAVTISGSGAPTRSPASAPWLHHLPAAPTRLERTRA